MRFLTIFSVLAVACGVIAIPLDESANIPNELVKERDAEAIPIPTLLPLPQLAARDRKEERVLFGWFNMEKKKGYGMTEKTRDPMYCHGNFSADTDGDIKETHVVFGALCFFYEKDCDPEKGKADAMIGWEGEKNKTVNYDWKINSFGCKWAKQTNTHGNEFNESK